MRARLLLPALACLLCAFGPLGCGADFAEDDTVDGARAAELSLVIASLRFQEVTLRVHGDACFTLVEHDGTLLAEHVTREELEAIAPETVQRYDRMVAGYTIDASVEGGLLTPSDPYAW